MQWNQLLTTVRFGQEHRAKKENVSLRSEFQRDYDRLIFSSSFRRLQNKTQVFPLPGSVFVHNRLTHSLEVASIGRSLGNYVSESLQRKYNLSKEDITSEIGTIVSAACLAHDMGNPPFGHSGEKGISAYFLSDKGLALKEKHQLTARQWEDLTNFEGNANALRLLTHHFKGWQKGSFSLTYTTLAALIKYPYDALSNRKKYGFFDTEEETFLQIAQELQLTKLGDHIFARHPLVYLVEAADDISYLIMDLEDAYKLNIIHHDEVKSLLLNFHQQETQQALEQRLQTIGDLNEQIAYLRAVTINKLVLACGDVFLQFEEKMLEGTFSGSLSDYLPPLLKEALKKLSHIGVSRIYNHRKVLEIELAGDNILNTLVGEFIQAIESNSSYSKNLRLLIPQQFDITSGTPYQKIRSIIDFISGMTDLYALDLYRNIKGIQLPSLR